MESQYEAGEGGIKMFQEQKEILVEFMEDHPDFAKSKLIGNDGKQTRKAMWEVLTARLNSVNGPKKNSLKWQRVWIDLKNKVKKKASTIKNSMRQTGGGPQLKMSLNEMEMKILNILGEGAVYGLESTPDAPLDSEDVNIPPSQQIIQPSTSQTTPPDLSSTVDTDIAPLEEHNYSMPIGKTNKRKIFQKRPWSRSAAETTEPVLPSGASLRRQRDFSENGVTPEVKEIKTVKSNNLSKKSLTMPSQPFGNNEIENSKQAFVETANTSLLDIKPEFNDCQKEYASYYIKDHFSEHSISNVKEEPESKFIVLQNMNGVNFLDCPFNEHNQTRIKTEAKNSIIEVNETNNDVYTEWKVKNEEIDIKVEENDASTIRKQHVRQNSKVTKFKCDQCEYATVHKGNLNLHLLKHKNPEEVSKFKCDQCNFKTLYKPSFKLHLLKHKSPEEVAKFKCDQCGYTTAYKGNLTSHLIKHKRPEQLYKFKCDQCEFSTVRKKSLRLHLIKHKNPDEVAKFKCDQCEYATVRKGNLKLHLIKHKNPEEFTQFKCNQCEYASGRKHHLKLHLLKHKNYDGVSTLKCDQCDYVTGRKDHMKFHLLKHKNPVEASKFTFTCDQCDYETFYKYSLKRHIILKHKL